MLEKIKLTFHGGVGTVTGVNFLFDGLGKKILIDAGLSVQYTPDKIIDLGPTPYKPEEIDFIFVSHAHLDNIGKIPILVKEGFKGVIYSTVETKALSELILRDCLDSEASEDIKILFSEENINKTMSLWKTESYVKNINLGDDLKIKMYDAGHSLGSVIFELKHDGKNMVFVNSLGGTFVLGLSGMDKVKKINYLIMESVYGNKMHDTIGGRKSVLENFIENTVRRDGTVLMPITSIDKIYIILMEIRRLVEDGRIPRIPIFIDSILTHKAINVYSKIFSCGIRQCTDLKDFVESFKDLKIIENETGAEEVYKTEGSKIVITGASNSGIKRMQNYIEKFVSDPNSSIVFVDYQDKNSIGRKLQDGVSEINIEGKDIPVISQVETINGYSSHADHNKLFQFIDDYKNNLEKVFIVIGEPQASEYLAQKLKDRMGVNTKIPKKGDFYELDF